MWTPRRIIKGFSVLTLCLLLGPATLFVTIVSGFIFMDLPRNLPDPSPTLPSQPTKLLDIDGNQIADLRRFDQNIPVKQEDIPEILKQALISAEDRSFYDHGGVDPRGTLRALWADITHGEVVQGGSTITQQYVKKAYVGEEQTVTRKLREAVVATQVDRQMSKDEIIWRYLDIVYMGDGSYGVGAAAQSYFRKSVKDLNASEAATLVGVIPAPSAWAPRDNPEQAEVRRVLVLDQMHNEGYLDDQQYEEAKAAKLFLEGSGEPEGPVTRVHPQEKAQAQYPYFVDYVRRYLVAKFGEDTVYTGGLSVQTTMSPALQAQAEKTIGDTLNGTSAPLDMSLVAVEPPTGYVKALVGGRDFSKAQVNLALGGCPPKPSNANGPIEVQVEPTCWHEKTVTGGGTGRQPGSSFKPFVLTAAYEVGIQPTTTYNGPPAWSPPGCTGSQCVINNYEGGAGGTVNLKQATAESLNTVYAPLIRDVGSKENGKPAQGFIHTAEIAKKMGVTSAYYAQGFHQVSGAYALGTIDVSPLDMAASYGVYANRGLRQPATPVVKVVDAQGNVLEDNTNREPQRVLEENVADNVTDALRTVITEGTARSGNIGRPAAGKTGTSENYSNAWFVGYTPTLSTSVWMGYSDTPRTINYKGNRRVAGGGIPTQTWKKFMDGALKDVPVTDFSQPAPIQAPARDVLGGPTVQQSIRPAQQRRPIDTPTGDYNRVQGGVQAATPPTTAPPASAAGTAPAAGQ